MSTTLTRPVFSFTRSLSLSTRPSSSFRLFSPIIIRNAAFTVTAAATNSSSAPKRDEQIQAPLIRLVHPETGKLTEPAPTRDLLANFDRSRFWLVEVDANSSPPVCKLVDKKEAWQKTIKASKKKNKTQVEKEIVITWAVSPHDLEHKLDRGKQFLRKGDRLVVTISRGRSATQQQAREALLKSISDSLQSDGTMPKPPERQGNIVKLTFSPLSEDQRKAATSAAAAAAVTSPSPSASPSPSSKVEVEAEAKAKEGG